MSEQAPPRPTDDPPAPRPAKARRRVAALALAAVVLVLVAAGGWWLTHPDRMTGPGVASTTARATVGHRVFVGMDAQPDSGTVHLKHVTPRVADNSARAGMRVLLCHSADPHTRLGVALDTAGRLCGRPVDPRGADLSATAPGTYLVLEVTPHRPGIVRVEGLRVTYRAGWRKGTENSGEDVTVRVTRGTAP